MAENDDLLGLGALWDLERDNAALDEFREIARDHRSRGTFHDAVLDLAQRGPLEVLVASSEQSVHVDRIGLNWVDGRFCDGTDTVIVPLGSVQIVRHSRRCSCPVHPPAILEWVTVTAVLRRLERRATPVIVSTVRSGLTGRIVGVWRDAVELRTPTGRAVVPVSNLELVVVEGAAGA